MRYFVLTASALALAGCVSTQTAGPTSATPPAPQPGSSIASMTATGPTRAPAAPNHAAEDICVKAVQQATNEEGVGVLASEPGQGHTLVMLGFPDARSPWRCLVAPDGRVTEVKPTGAV